MNEQIDLSDIQALDRECYPDNPISPDQWRRLCTRPDYRVGYCDEPGRGFYLVREVVEGGEKCLKLLRLGVAERDRRQGLGNALLTLLGASNCEVEVRESNLSGLKLLTGAGFSVMGMEPGRFGNEDGVVLWRAGKGN